MPAIGSFHLASRKDRFLAVFSINFSIYNLILKTQGHKRVSGVSGPTVNNQIIQIGSVVIKGHAPFKASALIFLPKPLYDVGLTSTRDLFHELGLIRCNLGLPTGKND